MRVAVGQMVVEPGELRRNFSVGVELAKRAASEGCRLILLPEVWISGFMFKKLKEIAQRTPEFIEELKELSDRIAICGTYVVDSEDNERVYNRFMAIDKGRVVFEYDKTMLFSVTGEDRYFLKGSVDQKNTFDIDGVRFGVSVCYELRFPEFFRRASFAGAQVHLHPAIWPINRLEHWRTLTKARSIENQFYLLCSNGCGTSGKWELAGFSTIYSPWGEELRNLEYLTAIAFVEVNIDEIEEVRKKIPSLRDSIEVFS